MYNIYWTDLHEICRPGKTLAVDKRSEVIFFDLSRDVATATNWAGKIGLQYTPCSLHDIHYGGAASIRQEGQLLRTAQANKLPDLMDEGELIK